MFVESKAMLRVQNKFIKPGEKADIEEKTAKKLLDVGLVKATKSPPEKAVKDAPVEMSVAQLRKLCKEKDLPVYGNKAELLARLEGG